MVDTVAWRSKLLKNSLKILAEIIQEGGSLTQQVIRVGDSDLFWHYKLIYYFPRFIEI